MYRAPITWAAVSSTIEYDVPFVVASRITSARRSAASAVYAATASS